MTRADFARIVLVTTLVSIPAVGAAQPPDPQPRFKSSAVAQVLSRRMVRLIKVKDLKP